MRVSVWGFSKEGRFCPLKAENLPRHYGRQLVGQQAIWGDSIFRPVELEIEWGIHTPKGYVLNELVRSPPIKLDRHRPTPSGFYGRVQEHPAHSGPIGISATVRGEILGRLGHMVMHRLLNHLLGLVISY